MVAGHRPFADWFDAHLKPPAAPRRTGRSPEPPAGRSAPVVSQAIGNLAGYSGRQWAPQRVRYPWRIRLVATVEKSPSVPPEIMAELQEAADVASRGIRDPEVMRKACEEMDRIREEIRREHGILDIGLPAIRGLRDGE